MVHRGIVTRYSRFPLEERKGILSAEIRHAYPDLAIYVSDGHLIIRGGFPVVHDKETLDRYLVEISLPDDFPNSEPFAKEIGGRIPHVSDRHVNPNNGTICWQVPEEWLLEDNRSLLEFLEGPLRNFFLGNSLHEFGKPFPFGERKHGIAGLVQSYGPLFDAADQDTILRYLDCLSHDMIRGHWDCPCGSGLRLRKCHLEQLVTLKGRITPRIAKSAARRLREQIALAEKGNVPLRH